MCWNDILPAIVLSLASCTAIEHPCRSGDDAVGVIRLDVVLCHGRTRSADVFDYEAMINTAQVFVFDHEGRLAAYEELRESTSAEVEVMVGTYDVWALVNAPPCHDIHTMDALESMDIMLECNTIAGGLVMSGRTSVDVSMGSVVTAEVTVERLVSRVYVRNITNECPQEYGDMVVKGIFLANVVGNQNICGDAEGSVWYNRCGCAEGVQGHLIDGAEHLADAPDMTWRKTDRLVPNGQTENIGACLYGYRNLETEESDAFPFTPRLSRLYFIISQKVLETGEYQDNVCYVNLVGQMVSNQSCCIDLLVTGTADGGTDRRIAINISSCQVVGWATAGTGAFNI